MRKGQVIIYLVVFLLPVCSYAYQFDPPWINLDSFIMNFKVYDSNLPTVQNVDSFTHTGWGYVAFDDTDNSGTISSGDKFKDYVVYYVTSFLDAYNTNIPVSDLNVNWQVAFEAVLEGHITSVTTAENFVFDRLVEAHLWVDSATDLNGLTLGSFSDATKLGYYLDGGELLKGVQLVNGSSAGNNGYLGLGANGQGKYQVAVQIEEGQQGSGFLQDNSHNNLFDIWEVLAVYPDGDLTRWNPNNPTDQAVAAAFQQYYNLPATPFNFAYTLSTQDGSTDFGAVPEPATFLLFGTGILSLGGFFRKNKSKK